jgi:hypothetical protein
MTPFFETENCKWYIEPQLQAYLEEKQAENLPSLYQYGCFKVIGEGFIDYVLIDNRQNFIFAYEGTPQGYEQMIASINILKIAKSYDNV